MSIDAAYRAQLYEILNDRMILDDIPVLCLYLDVDYENLSGETKSKKIISLIEYMNNREQMSFFCHKIIQLRPDMEEAILKLGIIQGDLQLYIDIATGSFLPLPGIDHVLRNPREIYISLRCASAPQDEVGDDAIYYINRSLQEKSAVLVIGDYGTGKSFLAQKLFLEHALLTNPNYNPNPRIPILLPLKQLVGRGPDLVIPRIMEHLRMLRFLDWDRQQGKVREAFEARLRAGDFLCILDGFDEIPLISIHPDPLAYLDHIIQDLAIGNNQIVITSRPGILPNGLDQYFKNSIPNVNIGYLLPWHDEATWWEYLRMCQRLGIDFGPKGYDEYGKWILANPELRQLIKTPLFCQMLVETRNDIIRLADVNVADLYDAYVNRYFENVSERSPVREKFDDLNSEIKYKKDCLMAIAVKMLESNVLRISQQEIEDALLSEAQEYGDDVLAGFTRIDALIYSLLIADADRKFSFSHKSFYEFFLACKIHKEITERQDQFAILSQTLLTKEVISFLAALIHKHDFRNELQEAFGKADQSVNQYEGTKTLLRNLVLTYLELEKHIEGITLDDVDLSGYALSSPTSPKELINVSFNGSNLEATVLISAALRGSCMRSARMNKCVLDRSDLRDVDFSGAELQDISCRNARFSGANFAGVIIKVQDAERLLDAFKAEQNAFPHDVETSWIQKTEVVLRRYAI